MLSGFAGIPVRIMSEPTPNIVRVLGFDGSCQVLNAQPHRSEEFDQKENGLWHTTQHIGEKEILSGQKASEQKYI